MRLVALLLLLPLLGACAYVPGYAQAEGASLVVTKKTIGDHFSSYRSGKNCSMLRLNQNLPYCEEDEALPQPEVFCYRTLGEITCYDRPDPSQQSVGVNDHNYIRMNK